MRQREPDDYYTTPSYSLRRLFEAWQPPELGTVVEPSAGNGAIIRAAAHLILPARWFAYEIREEERETLDALCSTIIGDFLRDETFRSPDQSVTAVIGNPPFSKAVEFVLAQRELFG